MQGKRGDRGDRGVRGDTGPRGDEGIVGGQGMQGAQGERGEAGKYEAIHPFRWAALTIWIVIFTAIVIYTNNRTAEVANDNQATIHELFKTKASLHQLEHTNCGLKIFLLTARKTRYNAYLHDTTKDEKRVDLDAVNGYKALADKFQATGGACTVPRNLFLPFDKKRKGK